MASDISQIQIGTTLYSWGGWDASGYHNVMYITDLLTGAQRIEILGRVRFLAQGFVTNPAWNWMAGKLIYLLANGAMTQTRPVSGPVTILGIAWSSTTICLDPQPPRVV